MGQASGCDPQLAARARLQPTVRLTREVLMAAWDDLENHPYRDIVILDRPLVYFPLGGQPVGYITNVVEDDEGLRFDWERYAPEDIIFIVEATVGIEQPVWDRLMQLLVLGE